MTTPAMEERRLFLIILPDTNGLKVRLTSIQPSAVPQGALAVIRTMGSLPEGDKLLTLPGATAETLTG